METKNANTRAADERTSTELTRRAEALKRSMSAHPTAKSVEGMLFVPVEPPHSASRKRGAA